MTPQAFANAVAGYDKQERVLRRALAWDPSGGLFDAHKKLAGSATFDLLTGDAAGMLAGVGEHPAFTAFMKGTEPLTGRSVRGVVGQLEDRGFGRVLRQREELEAKLMRATGTGALMHDIGHVGLGFLPKGGAAEAALAHDFGHVSFPDVAIDQAAVIAAPPAVVTPFVDYPSPIVVPKRRSFESADPVIVPADLAEVSAGEEARANRIAVETMLRENNLDYELEHLELVAVRLVSGSKGERVHAAVSASLLFEGVANFVFPGQKEKFVDRNGAERSVEKKDVRNRISAFIDLHLRDEISTHDASRLQGKIDSSHRWSAEGHHVPYSPRLANRAYRDLLEVLAYVARAHDAASR
jgi:hypothetical protein